MANHCFQNLEGYSTNRPPLFDGTNYNYWKIRMTIFIQSIDCNVWEVIEFGPYKLTKVIKIDGKSDQIIPKLREEYDENDKRKLSLNARAKNILYCALDRNEFNRISTCDSAHEIWHALEITHVGTSKVKETKINILVKDFENFFMKKNEHIVDMITRFTDIVNDLKGFDRKFTNGELVSKMLRSLSEDWSPIRMLVENTKDINDFSLEELYGTLMTHELNRAETKEKTLKSKEEERRQIALKSKIEEGTTSDNESDEELDDLVRLVNKWRGFRNNRKCQKTEERSGERGKKIICYECDKPGHISTECPNKRKFIKKKALKATWDDSDDDEDGNDDQEETANMCFMAIKNKVNRIEKYSYD
jgi:hypothetical protein